jgi:hypothetical protein
MTMGLMTCMDVTGGDRNWTTFSGCFPFPFPLLRDLFFEGLDNDWMGDVVSKEIEDLRLDGGWGAL